MSHRFITAKMEQGMVDRISCFQKERGVKFFSDAVMAYIAFLESRAIPAFEEHEHKISIRPHNIDGDGRYLGEF